MILLGGEVHRGVTRTVLVIGRWAIKVPSLDAHERGVRGVLWSLTRGIQANLSECEWSGSPGTCPVLWSVAGRGPVRCSSRGVATSICSVGRGWSFEPAGRGNSNVTRCHGFSQLVTPERGRARMSTGISLNIVRK